MHIIHKYKNSPVQIKASIWFLVCAFLQKGISVLTTPIFTRLLTTEEYGNYNVFNSWMGIISIFATLNLSYAVYTQGLVKFSDDRKIFSSSLQGLTIVMISIVTVLYLIFRGFWNNIFHLTTVQMLAMFIMIWTSAVFSFWSSEQRVLYKYKLLVIITIVVSVMKPLIGIVFVVFSNDKVTARILGLVLVELIGYAWLFFVQMIRGKVFYSKHFWKYALLYNIPLIPHYLSQTVLNSADRIMIKDMIGESEAGIYSLAYSISLMMTLFNTALMQTISPWIYQKIKDNRIKDISSVGYITLVIIAMVNIFLILFAPEVIAIFAPESYYEAIWVIPPVAMSVYFMYCYDLFAKFAFYFEKTNLIMLASVIGAIINIVLNYVFIDIFGYIAAAYTTLVCYIIYSICHYYFMNKTCKENLNGQKPYNLNVILFITIPFFTFGFVLLLTYKTVYIRYGIVFLLFVLTAIFRKKWIPMIKSIINIRNQN